ncbi:hypothetical protein [Flavobacterium sp.]|jgi:hypothetical protein|uniref:hypothetical protein n=1 Tax=Flavobacterium sp. TaxID=239 RepID=UPI0037837668
MKTAVEWLFEQFVKKSCITLKDIQIAKQIEKEQIINACKQCSYSYEEAEQYYNETFKSE